MHKGTLSGEGWMDDVENAPVMMEEHSGLVADTIRGWRRGQ